MARIINHPLGELSGKVGAVVFKKTKYGSYLSSVPSGPPPKASALQELQQSKMKAVMHFLTPLRVILKHTFAHIFGDIFGHRRTKSSLLERWC